jgi:hypothetical protein
MRLDRTSEWQTSVGSAEHREVSRVSAAAVGSVHLNSVNAADDRLGRATGWIDQVHDHVEREAGVNGELQDVGETRRKEEAASERENRGEAYAGGGNATDGVSSDSGVTGPLGKFDIVIERESPPRTGFLGLSEGTPDYEDEELRPSNLRRNVLLSVLALGVVLMAWQWPTIRDYGLHRYGLPSAPESFSQAKPGNAGVPTSSTESVAQSTPELPPAVADRAGADHARPVRQTRKSREFASHAESNRQAEAMSSGTMGATNASVPGNQSPSISNQSSATALPGAFEMNRAIRAGDAELRATWLWRAVGKGNPQAPVELAKMYAQGSGVTRNCDQAQVLLRGAAEKGNEQARLNLQQIRAQGCSPR